MARATATPATLCARAAALCVSGLQPYVFLLQELAVCEVVAARTAAHAARRPAHGPTAESTFGAVPLLGLTL